MTEIEDAGTRKFQEKLFKNWMDSQFDISNLAAIVQHPVKVTEQDILNFMGQYTCFIKNINDLFYKTYMFLINNSEEK